ncbi:MAG: hypothetical protein HFI19_05485 [Lachnospiraceae bacterium]|jgi:hypothetical protein|nr:hypothetical protein [Lachnospiraceae bacterium]
MKDIEVQWHPGFVAAMNLELAGNRADLIYEKEYNLNMKPLAIDLLVIKKNAHVQIENEIGKLFRGHNIMEYKSPQDHLDIDVFYKSGAYASLYKAYGECVDDRTVEDITVSIVREAKPVGLFNYFEKHGVRMTNPYQGIYYILDNVLFPTQIIVTGELDKRNHIWLKALSDKMEKQDLKELLEHVNALSKKQEKELADSVLEVSIKANCHIANELRGGDSVCNALLELMEPEINKIVESKVQEAIQKAVRSFRDLGADNEKIREILMKNYALTSKEAGMYL